MDVFKVGKVLPKTDQNLQGLIYKRIINCDLIEWNRQIIAKANKICDKVLFWHFIKTKHSRYI